MIYSPWGRKELDISCTTNTHSDFDQMADWSCFNWNQVVQELSTCSLCNLRTHGSGAGYDLGKKTPDFTDIGMSGVNPDMEPRRKISTFLLQVLKMQNHLRLRGPLTRF